MGTRYLSGLTFVSIDLLVAALSTSQPRFAQPSLVPGNLLGSIVYKVPDSPLTTGTTLKIALQNSLFDEKSIKYLQRVQILTMLRISGVSSNITEDPEMSTIKLQHEALTVSEIIQHTSEIHLRALQTPPIAFSSAINREPVRALCRAVENPAHDHVWDKFPGILAWILLVGCAAAKEESTEYNYFMCLLIKVALGAGYGWLDSLTVAVRTFVKVKERAERWDGR